MKSLSMIKRGFFVAATLILFASCSGDNNKQQQTDSVPVVVATVQKKDVPVAITAVGIVEPSLAVSIISQVSGVLKAVHFVEGQEVKAGDLLFSIDAAPFEAQVKQAEANLARNMAEAANAQSQLKRYEGLVGKEYITKEQFDQVKANSLGSQANVKAAEAALEKAKLELAYCSIRSPINGRTGDLFVKAGNIVKANEAGTPLVKINQLKPALVRFSVPEKDLPQIMAQGGLGAALQNSAESMQVVARIKGNGQHEVLGRLSFVDNSVDRNTGTILLKGAFPNEDETLWPGQFVDVSLITRLERDALLVPSEAVQSGQQGQYVWVVKADMGVENRKIEVGFFSAQNTVIRRGLAQGETVVIDGQLRIGPQSRVQVKNDKVAEAGVK